MRRLQQLLLAGATVAITFVQQQRVVARPQPWGVVHVYGGGDHLPVDKLPAGDWASQALQDRSVMALHHNKTNGFFIDLAANDATEISNTYALEAKFH